MKRIFYIILSAIMLVTAVQFTSCKSAKMKDADEKYERGEYFAAAETYRKIYNKLKRKEDRYQRGEVAFMLGECYRHLNQLSAMSGKIVSSHSILLRHSKWKASTLLPSAIIKLISTLLPIISWPRRACALASRHLNGVMLVLAT